MFKYPIELSNIVLAILGVVLLVSGPYFIYRTVTGVIETKKADPKASIQPFNNGLNIVIGVLFFLGGFLFIVNNLRGNPLAM